MIEGGERSRGSMSTGKVGLNLVGNDAVGPDAFGACGRGASTASTGDQSAIVSCVVPSFSSSPSL